MRGKAPKQIKVVVATSVMLSFISFWRAAAIVLNDLGSLAFYVGGLSEQFVGKAAPWLIETGASSQEKCEMVCLTFSS